MNKERDRERGGKNRKREDKRVEVRSLKGHPLVPAAVKEGSKVSG